jgi:hypothetical protein
LLQIRAVVFGMAMGDRHRLRIAVGYIRASQGKARGIEMRQAEVNPFVSTDGQGEVTKQQVTAIGMDRSERAAELTTIEHCGANALTKQQVQGFVGKKLRCQGQGPIGKPQAIEDHPSHRFSWRDLLLAVGHQTRINHVDQPYVFDDLGKEPSMVQTFSGDQCHYRSSPASH